MKKARRRSGPKPERRSWAQTSDEEFTAVFQRKGAVPRTAAVFGVAPDMVRARLTAIRLRRHAAMAQAAPRPGQYAAGDAIEGRNWHPTANLTEPAIARLMDDREFEDDPRAIARGD